MTADLLRQAADKLDEVTAAAQPVDFTWFDADDADLLRVMARAAYIATMSPPVAKALAAWLRFAADHGPDWGIDPALTVAQAALGEGMSERVKPEVIAEQREKGWPDFHPEDYCHRCGRRNPNWYASREDWAVATAAWAAETGREGICCPTCFAEMHEAATGQRVLWCMTTDTEPMDDAEGWATIAFALARDVNRIKRICTQEHPPKMGSPTKDWEPGTETRHSDGTRCVLLEDGDCAIVLEKYVRRSS